MPTHIIRNGKLYLECTPQEVAASKLEKEIQEMVSNGVRFYATSTFDSPVTTNPSYRRKKHGL